ncbi:alpha/beta hydrolase domain-containing protein [Yoonia maritima]|uniref:alpha/beta hydrolase domain-containing protein n=1 Tax=Yoonia maritima TaxID=1435347 RepID=UPI0013A64AC2|nr:alpha/beta hydrolase domain-containing protein [Yoonia maritima]
MRFTSPPATSCLAFAAAFSIFGSTAFADAVSPATLTLIDMADSAPMSAAAVDLTAFGYSELEFFTEGTAQRYRGATLGEMDTAEVIDDGYSYRSRVLLRRPSQEAFNGTLVVEWTNVTAGQDIDFAFAEMHEHLLSQGYAVAVISAQKNGVDRLKTWSLERYGSLTVDADNVDPQGGVVDTCVAGPDCPVDPLAWDIFSQTVVTLKSTGNGAPLAGYDIETVIALGQSQSAFRLSSYYNTIQPLTGLFNGFLFDDLAPQLRTDLQVPAISVNSEVTADMFPPTEPSDFVRIWDLAGAAHSSVYGAEYVDRMVLRDASYPGANGPLSFTETLASQNCAMPSSYSEVDTGAALSAALVSLEAWAEEGTPAPASQVFARDADGKVLRDAEGLPIGGLQLPEFAVPATSNAINGPTVFCTLSGYSQDLTPDEMTTRYGTKDAYVAAVQASGQDLIEAGYLLPDDAKASVARAEAVDFAQ